MTDEPSPATGEPPAGVEGDPLAACTAVLMTVPYEVARRLQAFLRANDVACRIRKSDVSAEDLAKEALRSMSPDAAAALNSPIGRLIKGRLTRDLKAEISVQAPGLAMTYDVLVRPEDLPPELAGATAGQPSGTATDPNDPWDRPGTASDMFSAAGTEPDAPAETPAAPTGSPVALCELPWDAAWKLVSDLAAAGIPAAVLEPENPAGGTPMGRRIVPVGVRPADLERAKAMIER